MGSQGESGNPFGVRAGNQGRDIPGGNVPNMVAEPTGNTQGVGVGNPLAGSWPSTMSQPPNQGTLNRAVRAQHTCGVCLCPSFGAEAPFVSGVEPREVVAHRRRVQRVAHRRREGEEAGRRLDAHSMLPRVSRSAIAVSVAVEAGVDA